MSTTFAYETAPINSFKVVKTGKKGEVTEMEVAGRSVVPTQRFWTSICSNFSNVGLSKKLFGMFSHAEVFDRLSKRFTERLNYTVASDGKTDQLLAVTKPGKSIARNDSVMELLGKHEGKSITYDQGIVQSWHTPPRMENFKLGDDVFMPKFTLETPIDGFGNPLVYLSLIRQICTNGTIGYARAFRSEIALGNGDDILFTLDRALDSYQNEEGYAALRNRLESSMTSWASVAECNKVMKTLSKITSSYAKQGEGSPRIESVQGWDAKAMGSDGANLSDLSYRVQKGFNKMSGDFCHLYGIAHLDALSQKKMQALPSKAKVYDLFNYCTEVATHYLPRGSNSSRQLQAIVGGMLGGTEYDLEGSVNEAPTFADWHLATPNEAKGFRESQEADLDLDSDE